MLYKILSKQSRVFVAAIVLSSLSFSLIKSDDSMIERGKNYFDVRDKNIGFSISPIPNTSDCRLDQAVTGQTTTLYWNSVMSPTIAVNPHDKHLVVAAWEQGISCCGDGIEIGIAYSQNGGKRWKQTIIPIQNCVGGFSQSVNSVSLSYGIDGKVYLTAAVLNISEDPNTLNQSGIIASFSSDNGQTWSNPRFLVASQDFLNITDPIFPLNGKPSITADPNIASTAYAVWSNSPETDLSHSDTFFSMTTNGGLTWSDHALIYDPFNDATLESMSNGIYNNVSVDNNMIVALSNGNLLNFMTRKYATPGATDLQYTNDVWPYQFTNFDIAVVRSLDNGATWETDATQIATIDGNSTFTNGYTYSGLTITGGVGAETSTQGSNQFFDVTVNPNNGYLYVVWQSGQFTVNQLPQIALSTSRNGGLTWSSAARVSRTPINSLNPQAFTASVTVDDENHVGILYYDFRNDNNTNPNSTKTDAWFAEYKETISPVGGSTGIGLDFVQELRINENSFIMQNGPRVADQFVTSGDYNGIVGQGDDFYAVYVKSHNGPFLPATTLIDDIETGTLLLLDNNKRTSPYFSRIDAK